MVTPPPGHGRLRASHADREQVVGVLKAAYIQGRLAGDELAERAGLALAAQTYSDLAALTADLPAGLDLAPAPAASPAAAQPLPARTRNPAVHRAVTAGAGAIAVTMVAAAAAAVIAGQPAAALILAVVIVVLAAAATAFVASLIAVAVGLESRHRNRSRRPRPAAAGPGRGLTRPGALPRRGRTDRELAAGHGRAEPAGLVLAGSARCLRRGRARPGLGYRRADDVLRGGVPDHRRRALAVRRLGRRAVDGRPPRRVHAAVGRMRAVHRGRRLGRRAPRTGHRGPRRARQRPSPAGARDGRGARVGRRRRGALARPDRDGMGHGRHRVPHADAGCRLPRPGCGGPGGPGG